MWQAQCQAYNGRRALFGSIMCGLSALRGTRLCANMPPHRRRCQLSAGSPGVDRFWATAPIRDTLRLTNTRWAVACARRQGIIKVPQRELLPAP